MHFFSAHCFPDHQPGELSAAHKYRRKGLARTCRIVSAARQVDDVLARVLYIHQAPAKTPKYLDDEEGKEEGIQSEKRQAFRKVKISIARATARAKSYLAYVAP